MVALTITLTGGAVTPEVDANLTSLNEYDRRFVIELVGLLLTHDLLSPQAPVESDPIIEDPLSSEPVRKSILDAGDYEALPEGSE